MRKLIVMLQFCTLAFSASAQNYEALNNFMEKYSSTWPKSHSMNSEVRQQIGQPMPTYYLNKKYNSQRLKGRFVLLNFWATWCSGCRLLSVDLDSLMIRNNAKEFADVQLIGVDAQESLASKGFDPDEWWAEKGIGFPTIGGKGADDCCLSVKGGHPCMILIDDKGIIRGRWDAWTPSAAEEARLAVWALHVVPRDGIRADTATVNSYLAIGRNLEAAYLLSLMPEEISSTALRFKALTAISGNDAVALFNKFVKQCKAFKPSNEWAQWNMPQSYVTVLKDISEFVYLSDINNTALLDCGSRAVRMLMNTNKRQNLHYRTMLGVLRYRYGRSIMESGRQSLNDMLNFERRHSTDTMQYQEVENAMLKYDIKFKDKDDALVYDASSQRMFEVDEESKRHMAGLNDTIDIVKDKASKIQARFIVPQKMRSGKQSSVEVLINIAEGWHAYANTEQNRKDGYIPTTVDFVLPKGFKAVGEQRIYPKQMNQFNGSVIVAQDFICPISKNDKKGKGYPVRVKMTYQICDGGQCLPPVDIEVGGVLRMLDRK